MQITFDTNNLTDLDRDVLVAIVEVINGDDSTVENVPTPEPVVVTPVKATPAKKVAPAPEPEPEVPTSEEAGDTGEEDLVGGETYTLSDAVAAATQLVSSGGAAKVKAALAEVGAKRVSEMDETSIPAFMAALQA